MADQVPSETPRHGASMGVIWRFPKSWGVPQIHGIYRVYTMYMIRTIIQIDKK